MFLAPLTPMKTDQLIARDGVIQILDFRIELLREIFNPPTKNLGATPQF